MSVLVTGGMGAVGACVTRELVERGLRPVVYDARLDTTLLSDLIGKFDVVLGDILDLPRLLHTIQDFKVDRIIHLVALINADANPPLAIKINCLGTVNILEAARLLGIKRVAHASTNGVYGGFTGEFGHPTYKPVTEADPIKSTFSSMYSLTKQTGELLGLHYAQKHGVDVLSLRFASMYGSGKMGQSSVPAPCRMVENAILGKPFRLPQGAEQRTDFVYTRDVGNSLVLACLVEKTKHRTFNIGTGKSYTLGDVAEAIKAVIPNASFDIGPGTDWFGWGAPMYSVFDITQANKELGYSPRYNLAEGVADYIKTIKQLSIAPTYSPQ